MQGYCVLCKVKQEMVSATRTIMRNGMRAMIGNCICCGAKMIITGYWDNEQPHYITQQTKSEYQEQTITLV